MDDRELVTRLIAGDRDTWSRFVRDQTRLVAAMVSRVLGADADADVDDAVQAVFAKLWDDDRRRLRAFRGQARLSTWVAAVARREALDRLRRRRRLAVHERNGDAHDLDRVATALRASPVGRAARDDDVARLRAALATLRDRDRLLILWILEDGLPYARVAELLDVRENSVGPLLSRARQRLLSVLEVGADRPLYGSPPVAPPTGRSGT